MFNLNVKVEDDMHISEEFDAKLLQFCMLNCDNGSLAQGEPLLFAIIKQHDGTVKAVEGSRIRVVK